MSSPLRRLGALAAGLVMLAGCSADRIASPSARQAPAPQAPAAAPSADLLGGLLGVVNNLLTPVVGVQRTTPLSQSITVSQLVGTNGGTLSIPAAGVQVTVPAGALSRPLTISMTARAGGMVAYDFEPHGTTFAKPLVITQTLAGTNATTSSQLQLGYYSDPSLLGSILALVSELIGGVLDTQHGTFSSTIKHFSGYVVACGRGGE